MCVCVCMYQCIFIFTYSFVRIGCNTKLIFKRSIEGLNSEFSFSQIGRRAIIEQSCLSFYLPIARGRIIGFIRFPRVFVQCERQTVLSRCTFSFCSKRIIL